MESSLVLLLMRMNAVKHPQVAHAFIRQGFVSVNGKTVVYPHHLVKINDVVVLNIKPRISNLINSLYRKRFNYFKRLKGIKRKTYLLSSQVRLNYMPMFYVCQSTMLNRIYSILQNTNTAMASIVRSNNDSNLDVTKFNNYIKRFRKIKYLLKKNSNPSCKLKSYFCKNLKSYFVTIKNINKNWKHI
jgi:hypothetical protein